MSALGGDECSFCRSSKNTRTIRPDIRDPIMSVALCYECCATLLQLEVGMMSRSQAKEWSRCVCSGELPHLHFMRSVV